VAAGGGLGLATGGVAALGIEDVMAADDEIPVCTRLYVRVRVATTTPPAEGADHLGEREAIRAEGLDPDDPAVVTAIDLVRWELSMLNGLPPRRRAGDLEVGVG
jgi:hypothetical protein